MNLMSNYNFRDSKKDTRNLFKLASLLFKGSLGSSTSLIHSPEKMRLAGLRVLDKFVDSKGLQTLKNTSPSMHDMVEDMIPLIKLFKVYKKGEENFFSFEEAYFANSEEGGNEGAEAQGLTMEDLKKEHQRTVDPYSFFIQSLCDVQFFDFKVPSVFNDNVSQINMFNGVKYENLGKSCSLLIPNEPNEFSYSKAHDFFFERPVEVKVRGSDTNKYFENLYLAIDDHLQENFKDDSFGLVKLPDEIYEISRHGTDEEFVEAIKELEKKEEEQGSKGTSGVDKLGKHWEDLSERQIKTKGEKLFEELEEITESYYKDIVTHNQVDEKTILSYYSPKDIVDDSLNGKQFKDLKHKVYTKRSFPYVSIGYPHNIENAIYQVNFWMEALKDVLKKGDRIKALDTITGETVSLNKQLSGTALDSLWKGFDEDKFEIMQKEVLSTLQDYNESGKKEKGPYVRPISPVYLGSLKTLLDGGCLNESRMSFILDEYHSKTDTKSYFPTPPLLGPDLVLGHILAHSIPILQDTSILERLTGNKMFNHASPWEELIFSVLFELHRSLDNFFFVLHPLTLKDSTESLVASKKLMIEKDLEEEVFACLQKGQAEFIEGLGEIFGENILTEEAQ